VLSIVVLLALLSLVLVLVHVTTGKIPLWPALLVLILALLIPALPLR
jgi:hypothetical protein